MLCSDQSGITSRNRLPLAFWLGLAATLLSYQAGYAETPKDGSLPNLPTLPIEWTSGPADVRLGSVANFSVPADYKFTDAKGARIELQQMKVPAGKGILGLLEPK